MLAFIMALPFGACNDIIDLKSVNNLPTSTALQDLKGVTTALFGAYDGMQALNYYGRDFIVFPEVRADNAYVAITNSNRFLSDYNYQLSANTTQTGFWNAAYAAILDANNVINIISSIKDGSAADRNQVLGEALAIRAICHFDLVRVFGKPYYDGNGSQLGVPIKLDNKVVDIARNTVGEVYSQVIADLTTAQGLLSNANTPFRFSADAVNALLARVYLYKGDNANAVTSASLVINSGRYTLTTGAGLTAFWGSAGAGNKEEIFTLHTLQVETRGADNLGSIFNPSETGGYGDIRVTSDIRSAFGTGTDLRKAASYSLNANGDYYVAKYIGESSTPGLVSPKILRLAEMYLIRAEANAKLGNTVSADADVAIIRTRAGAVANVASATASAALDAVLREKRLEFTFEGHRSFDLFRNGKDMIRIQCNTGKEVNVSGFCSVSASSNLRIYPIPQRELDANKLMIQNDL